MFAVAVAVVVIAVGAVVVAPLVVVVVVIIVVVVRIVGVLGIFVTSVAGAVVVVVVVAAVLAGPVVDVAVVVGDGRLLSSIPGGVNRVTNPPLFRRGPRLGTPRQHPFFLEGRLTVPGHFKRPKGRVSRRNVCG